MSSEESFPLLPLRGLVLFPGQLIPLLIKRKSSHVALLSAADSDNNVFLVQQKDSAQEEVTQNDLFCVGVEGRVVQLLKLPNQVYKVLIGTPNIFFLMRTLKNSILMSGISLLIV